LWSILPCCYSLPHLQELLSRLLGGEVKLFTTPCISKELTNLGTQFAAAAATARQQQLHKCGHTPAITPCDCLLEAVSHGNKQHWWVATQDRTLQAALDQQQGVPLLFASVNGLHLSDPPQAAKAAIAAGTAQALALPAHERHTDALKDLHELRPKDESYKAFRRKHAKGPNPLSVKKKSSKRPHTVASASAAAEGGNGQEESAAAAAKKRRKRRKQQQGVQQ
jgi:U3 small nucleolar RNA-associated protein 23